MKLLNPFRITELSYSKLYKSPNILRHFLARLSSSHVNDWELEDDDLFQSKRPSYGSRNEYNRPSRYNQNQRNNSDNFRRGRNDSDNFRRGRDDSFAINSNIPDWKKIELQPFERNFYTPSDSVSNRTEEELYEYRKLHGMTLSGSDIPNPIQEFSDYEFPQELVNIFSQKGFTKPTPIQAQGWPIALSGQDLIGIAQTGSGKTLGYMFPSIVHINNQKPVDRNDGPIALVVAPTRELVQQIYEVSIESMRHSRIRAACLFGGASKNLQANQLQQLPSICIATPGRLLDFLKMGVTNLQRCTYLVLDEADRMLDMGFEPQIRSIVDQIRPDRQTLMWSATWPREVEELAQDFLSDAIQLNIGGLDLSANAAIEQQIEFCDDYDKKNRFVELLRAEMEDPEMKVLIFAQTKVTVDFLTKQLNRDGIRARGIHGDYSQASRDNTMKGFKTGRFNALIATDVASRGLDVNDISLVINYDLPPSISDYIHRIGRTGRAGKSGRALSLFTPDNADIARELVRVLKQASQPVPSELEEYLNRGPMRRGNNKNKRYNYNRGNSGFGRENDFRSRY